MEIVRIPGECECRGGPPEPTASICIPTYDIHQPHVQQAIKAIHKHTHLWHYEIVVADCQRELLGYTKPQNAAMAAGRGAVLIALNDDVLVSPNWFGTLLVGLFDTYGWCATPDATHTDGPQVFAPYCMMLTQRAWKKLGGLDEQFVFWCSDIDFARRLVDAGHPPLRVPLDPPIRHGLNTTANQHPELNEICAQDLQKFRFKWGTDAESEKHRLAALTAI